MKKRIVRFVVAAVGFVAAVITIVKVLDRQTPDVEIQIVTEETPKETPKETPSVVLTPSEDIVQPIVGDTITVQGTVVFDEPVYIVGNHLDLGDSNRIKAPEINIISTRVIGGILDASGTDAESPGGDGANAGSIFIASAKIHNTHFLTAGGNGANGRNGRNGANGRDGECGPGILNKWKGAHAGGNGEPGGNGGAGGNGGTVSLLVSQEDGFPEPNVAGGTGGQGGQGGQGGTGGRGCTGLGGSQASQPNGQTGTDGTGGNNGENGRVVKEGIKFRDVKEIIDESDLRNIESLRNARQKLLNASD